MAILKLLDGADATGAGTEIDIASKSRRVTPRGIVQAIISDTATAAIEGSLDGDTWFEIDSLTASGGTYVYFVPRYVRGNVTAFTSGTVDLLLEVL
jgi:hypothetical protein